MNKRTSLMLLLWLVLVYAGTTQEQIHIVQKGETLYSIGRTYGIKPEEIARFNGISLNSPIKVGQKLRIPSGSGVSSFAGNTREEKQKTFSYRVERGDTLYSLARRHNTTVDAIRRLNNMSPQAILREGMVLLLPALPEGQGSAPASAGGTVTSGGIASTSEKEGDPSFTGPSDSGKGGNSSLERSESNNPALRWPVQAKSISTMTGKLQGVILTGEVSESVKSLSPGIVVSAGPYRGFGRVAIIQAPEGYLYVYGGCASLSVTEGERVLPGTELGKLGVDSISKKPQLFFMVYRNNVPIDPQKAPRY
ncbi:MAG TPA: M23 family metallopeptidase [Termitinemataceae bacterium]|nr:M23 family metallopeptidase [Termitinemataceae bacterium]HPQ00863.1 M23 family metallopeptidase [Termitinemataceae bacterium]